MTAALGGLMLAATISAASADEKKAADAPKDAKTGQCHGVNSCKGTGACNTATNSCAGKNSCKGQGWVKSTKADCDAKGGKFTDK
jgi:hypothetical protein